MTAYLALLRGVNVGAANRIRMEDLRRIFERLGFSRVETFIQSGNVLFESEQPEAEVVRSVEAALLSDAEIRTNAIVRSAKELAQTVSLLPFAPPQPEPATTGRPEGETLFVCFAAQPPGPERFGKLLTPSAEGDEYRVIGRDAYLLLCQSIRVSRLAAQLQRALAPVTVRNWQVVCRLSGLLSARQTPKN